MQFEQMTMEALCIYAYDYAPAVYKRLKATTERGTLIDWLKLATDLKPPTKRSILNQVKMKSSLQRQADLLELYEAVSQQYRLELSALNKIPLKRQLADLEEQLKIVETELSELQ